MNWLFQQHEMKYSNEKETENQPKMRNKSGKSLRKHTHTHTEWIARMPDLDQEISASHFAYMFCFI